MDELIEKVGSFGKYQKALLIIIGSVTAMNGLTQFMSVFNNAVPKQLCAYKQNNSLINNGSYLPNSCEIFKNISLSKLYDQDSPFECQYDTTHYDKTIVTEYDLICDRLYLASLTQTLYMIGSMVSFFTGFLSDRHGRKFVCFIMSLLLCVSIVTSEAFQVKYFNFTVDVRYTVYLISQFILGFTVYSLDINTYVLLVESTTQRHVNFLSIVNINMYVLGELALLGISYYFRDWNVQNWFAAGMSLTISLIIIVVLPESPRLLFIG